MVPNPPRYCPQHRARYQVGCGDCAEYRRLLKARRSRAIAYGTWQPRIDATPTQSHIATLLEQGMSLYQIALEAAVWGQTVERLHSRRQATVTPAIAQRIARVAPVLSMVDPIGAARRLQAMGRAGYGLVYLASISDLPRSNLHLWRHMHFDRVTARTHNRIDQLYQQLWCNDGPDRGAAAAAAARGWHPFEAWTDRTIDDPQAEPYSDPDAVGFVDWEKLDRVKLPPRHSLRVEFEELTFAEQTALYQAHLAAGRTPRSFRDRYRPVPIEIMRQLHPGVVL